VVAQVDAIANIGEQSLLNFMTPAPPFLVCWIPVVAAFCSLRIQQIKRRQYACCVVFKKR
jgi:hypothetical protein